MIAGVVLCGALFVQKYATLRMLDLDTSRMLREKKLRNRIMEDRIERTMRKHAPRILTFFAIPWRVFQRAFRRFAGRLVAIERRYHRDHAQDVLVSPEGLQSLLADAERALREERFQVAEERLVELVSVAPKFAQAYEVLSRVYSAKKEWKEALESLMCYVKLAPQDAEGRFLLGILHEEMGQSEEAFDAYTEALDIAPRNPKYLDAYISLALELEKRVLALRALKVLREVNPDNAKIKHFFAVLGEDEKKEEGTKVRKKKVI